MNGVHDMGGMHGFGPVEIEPPDAPHFHAAWEARVRAMMGFATGRGELFTIDAFRYGIEQMEPAGYLETPYYERWLTSLEWNAIQAGLVTREELEARRALLEADPDAGVPSSASGHVSVPGFAPPSEIRESPRFAVGDQVMTRMMHPAGHTRLPRYARGKRGTIHRVHPVEPLADISAHQPAALLEHAYHVKFESSELWGEDAEPGGAVYLDLAESYLIPAE